MGLCGKCSVSVYVCCGVCMCASLIPRPCTFVACSMKFLQKVWSSLSCDACRRRIFTSHPAYSTIANIAVLQR